MICEFALDPDLVATWHDRKEFLFFDEKFGIRTGRIVSRYPKKWPSLVWASFNRTLQSQNSNAQARLSAVLDSLCRNAVLRRSSFPGISDWLERTETEHSTRPFHGIVALTNPRAHQCVIRSCDLIERSHVLWTVPDAPVVPRNAQELVNAVAPLLRVCRKVLFVDPYFDPGRARFTEPFSGYMDQIWNCRCVVEDPMVELHTGIGRFFGEGEERSLEIEKRVADGLIAGMQHRLARFIPRRRILKVFIWKNREHGQRLHNRYILSEVAGIYFGTGLDQSQDEDSIDSDDINLLSATQLDARWKQFKGLPPDFDPVVEHPILIPGTK